MNTKQIWQALTCNSVTEPYFDGVFPSDFLKKIKRKPELIICNTDPSTKPGAHWVLFFFNNDTVDFYDSLGQDITHYGSLFINFVEKFAETYEQSNIRTQPNNSSLCGYYCLYYAYHRCQGQQMSQIINSMKSPLHVINFVNNHFKFCRRSKCSLLQSCVKY